MAKFTKEPVCIECKRRKKKCGRQRPTCAQCANRPAPFTCIYPAMQMDGAKDAPSNREKEIAGPILPAGEKAEQRGVKAKQEKVKADQEEEKENQEKEELVDVPKTTMSFAGIASACLPVNAIEDEGTARFKAIFAEYLEIDEEGKQLVEEHNHYLSVLGLLGLLGPGSSE